MLESKKKCCTL